MPDLLEEAKRLSESATPGPWRVREDDVLNLGEWQVWADARKLADWISEADAQFIARAHTLIPELVERVEQAENELNLARGVLSNFQTDKDGYCQKCGAADPRDNGHREDCIIGHVLADWPGSPAPGLAGGFSQALAAQQRVVEGG